MVEQLSYTGIGIMSGSSLDGVDLACCRFFLIDGKWRFQILSAETVPYPALLKSELEKSSLLEASDLAELDHKLGVHYGLLCNNFIQKQNLNPSFIASHGHTVFHRPEKGFSLQIGNGHDIAAVAGKTTIFDFRSLDVANGGQGAPLVPAGDRLLFGNFDICLNLGGFSNLSFELKGKRVAYDICPVNTILNYFAGQMGFDYDINGKIGKNGKVNASLLNKLNSLAYYKLPPPKSLGNDFLNAMVFPLFEEYKLSNPDSLSTFYAHIAKQISQELNTNKGETVLVTGGGAKNIFLLELIKSLSSKQILVPPDDVIDFKESIIFAFLGLLRLKGEINCYSSSTGASRDSSCGVIVEINH